MDKLLNSIWKWVYLFFFNQILDRDDRITAREFEIEARSKGLVPIKVKKR